MTTNARHNPRAFTLLEMLVVISIIVILIGLVIAGGAALVGNRKEAVTESVLQSLDRTLEEFMAANQNAIPPFTPAAYSSVPGRDVFAEDGEMVDGGLSDGDTELSASAASQDRAYSEYQGRIYPRYPDAAVFIAQVRGYGEADAILEGLGDKWLTPTPIEASSGPAGNPGQNQRQRTDVTPSVRDAWAGDGWTGGRTDGPSWPVLGDDAGLIFYVHPSNVLAQELYGRCVNRRPYFFSAGADRLYGVTNQIAPETGVLTADRDDSDRAINAAILALDDNLYSYEVGPANTTDPTSGGSFSKEYR
ncbi:MAG: prepilin-type N-terminal cleavage/methylation domain-containing protein [Phycisphaerales bacterium]